MYMSELTKKYAPRTMPR